MNCLDVHRILTAVPETQDPAVHSHLQGCSACTAFSKRQRLLDMQLREAIQITVPEGLAARILLRQSLGLQRKQKLQRSYWLAIAAGVVLTITLSSGWFMPYTSPRLEDVALAHVKHELHHLVEKKNVSLQQLNALLQPFQVEVRQAPGQLDYAGACVIRNSKGVHVVVEGKAGPVTVLFMPGEYIKGRRPIQDERFQGVLVPAQNGSMAIIGEQGEALDAFEERLRVAVRYIS